MPSIPLGRITAPRIAIIGTVGVPAAYGGFETLAENLARHAEAQGIADRVTIYCSARAYPDRPARFHGVRLRYVPLQANGAQSILYDIVSLCSAVWHRADAILVLGTSGALALPLIRMLSGARIVTNVDGLEWKRAKWRGIARRILRWSERSAVAWSHVVVADNAAVAAHVADTYGRQAVVIAYGGDHAVASAPARIDDLDLPARYALALCRIEPENNIAMILDAFAQPAGGALVIVGNWNNSGYGRDLKARFGGLPNIHLVDPEYDPGRVRAIRDRAWLYLHGHSAGGTNPALVEMMHFGIPVAAFDCAYNRFTTEGGARYFSDAQGLVELVRTLKASDTGSEGKLMRDIAARRYGWASIAEVYFGLFARTPPRSRVRPT